MMDFQILLYVICALLIGIGGTWIALRRLTKSQDNMGDVSAISEKLALSEKTNEENLHEISQLKDRCSELESAVVKEVARREKELKEEYDRLLHESNAEIESLSNSLRLAEDGKIDESLRQHLQESKDSITKLTKKIKILEDEIEDAEEEQEKLEKKLKAEKLDHQKTLDELDMSKKEKKRLSEDIERISEELSHHLDVLKLKNESIEFVQEILSAPESNANDVKALYRSIDFFEAFLRGQFMDCNAYLFNTYSELSFNDISGRSGFVEKKKLFLQMFEEWASVKRKSWLDQKTTIAFVGEFSAGKTSIVNRILSQDNPNIPLLPVSTKATTAIPTYIAGGVAETYNFVTPDDKFKKINEQIFKKVSKEVLDEIKGVSSLIKYFVMTYKNPNLNGLSILDTPGFNSNDDEDKKRTVEVINECDVLFWVVDVNNGTVNRSSISRIKEDLRKPIIVVINKVDTKANAEVDKVEKLIRQTFADEGVSVESVIRFSSKAPLADIMEPIKAVKRDATRDNFVSMVEDDLNQLASILEDGVNDLNKEYQNKEKLISQINDNYVSVLRNLVNDCEHVAEIPKYNPHDWNPFKDANYEMSISEANKMVSLLEKISNQRCQDLADIYDKQVEAVADAQQAYSDKANLRMSWQKVDDCMNEFKKVSKNLR